MCVLMTHSSHLIFYMQTDVSDTEESNASVEEEDEIYTQAVVDALPKLTAISATSDVEERPADMVRKFSNIGKAIQKGPSSSTITRIRPASHFSTPTSSRRGSLYRRSSARGGKSSLDVDNVPEKQTKLLEGNDILEAPKASSSAL